MKKILKRIKQRYVDEINFAKRNGFEGVMLPVNPIEGEPYYLESHYPTYLLEEIAEEKDWETFAYIGFVHKRELVISLERNPTDVY